MAYDTLDGEGPQDRPLSPLYNRSRGLSTRGDREARILLNDSAALLAPQPRSLPKARRAYGTSKAAREKRALMAQFPGFTHKQILAGLNTPILK